MGRVGRRRARDTRPLFCSWFRREGRGEKGSLSHCCVGVRFLIFPLFRPFSLCGLEDSMKDTGSRTTSLDSLRFFVCVCFPPSYSSHHTHARARAVASTTLVEHCSLVFSTFSPFFSVQRPQEMSNPDHTSLFIVSPVCMHSGTYVPTHARTPFYLWSYGLVGAS